MNEILHVSSLISFVEYISSKDFPVKSLARIRIRTKIAGSATLSENRLAETLFYKRSAWGSIFDGLGSGFKPILCTL
jgi:hypothetical protein